MTTLLIELSQESLQGRRVPALDMLPLWLLMHTVLGCVSTQAPVYKPGYKEGTTTFAVTLVCCYQR